MQTTCMGKKEPQTKDDTLIHTYMCTVHKGLTMCTAETISRLINKWITIK